MLLTTQQKNRKKAISLIKEYIGEGKDLLEATADAKSGLVSTLGLKNDDDIKLEVISDFKKKTLGLFGGCMAQVKAFIELPDEKPKKKTAKKEDKANKKAAKSVEKTEKKAVKEEKKEQNNSNTACEDDDIDKEKMDISK